ncbi:lytic transglycosylase domain-containing protein [Methylobacterium pseudosasicola]|uniref:Transglycosylase SLT domain-containing protein n=1 Tax=Methylobacterium pseudosasicola TaxID=582667 RepID=A0A1I4F6Q2_9HYPH|nr:transglycosylase SLT domain-containing protein [Methylobacterium pseudosasicola]SFL13199.1 Transglycosylase SLT domain-containing protein [Methylobacterium pseudosasicola]
MHRLLLAAALAVAPVAAYGQAPRDNIDALIEQQAKANGVPASFVHAVVKRESNYNPNAKGGSALGLMQIKHATARSLGYTGDAAGLLDPATNLRYGVAYLAGAYRTAQGNVSQAYQYYNRGYYYAAKRQGISSEVASVVAPVAASASALASLFGGGVSDSAAASAALAYAPTAAAVAAVPTETVEVPLPPRRPAAFSGVAEYASLTVEPVAAAASPATSATVQVAAVETVEVPLPPRRPAGLGSAVAAAAPAQLAELRLSPQAEPAPMTPAAATAPADAATPVAEAVEVPLPPRRPSIQLLAAAAPRRAPAAAAPVREATAIPVE